mmetsp:Transcript_9762/g.24783  ORF Transcript_9762/g.24783 Transcript_9762/m.24783 type:complete len:99 (+) Transcript_9762:43-339(+)
MSFAWLALRRVGGAASSLMLSSPWIPGRGAALVAQKSSSAKRFRLTASGKVRMKGQGLRHNLGKLRPRQQAARKARRYLEATPKILKKLRKLIKGQRG